MFEYKTQGVCSKSILFEVEDNKIKNLHYIGGCNGNLKGIGALVEGMDIDEVIIRLEGTICGTKNTSCPDQLTKALKAYKAENAK